MKFLDDLTLESFKNPFLYSVIGSYFLNNFPLIVGFAFNVSSNPIGESQVLIQELNISYSWFIILFSAQTLGKPTMALLISFIQHTFARWEKEILRWNIFFTYFFKYRFIRKENNKITKFLNENDKNINKILNSLILYLNKENPFELYGLVKYGKEIQFNKFIYFNKSTKQIETSDDDITKVSYCLGYCVGNISDYYIFIYESNSLDDETISKLGNLNDYRKNNYQFFTFIRGEIHPSNQDHSNNSFYYIFDEKKVSNFPHRMGVYIPFVNRELFYKNGIFDLDNAIKSKIIIDDYL